MLHSQKKLETIKYGKDILMISTNFGCFFIKTGIFLSFLLSKLGTAGDQTWKCLKITLIKITILIYVDYRHQRSIFRSVKQREAAKID